ncbi:hypothetical protein QM012_000757 [Aureobasidium pullulans]|uniref:Amidohydrolase-related domain-containing protein n=1 Tax=Aureobasidium pullulans TaxID=5580 RepID=A0ABR0TWJ0_AURPU
MATKIDVHHHFIPDAYIAAYQSSGGDPSGWQLPEWSVSSSLEQMDTRGTDFTILSLTAPGTSILKGRAASNLARAINLEAAKIRDEHPTRFGFFATLPPLVPDIEPVLKEISYALDILKADGVTLYTRYGTGNQYLGHAAFKPVWDFLEERKAIVFIHPTYLVHTDLISTSLPQPVIDYPHETARTAVDLLISNTIKDHPNVKIILSHAGGTLPFLATRAAHLTFDASLSTKDPSEFLEEARSFYFDLALSGNSWTVQFMLDFAKPGHVLFTTWAQQYGGIFTLKLGPKTMAVVTDRRLVKDLIDRKSAIYSERPESYVSHNLITKGDHLLVMHHGETWRACRRLIHQVFREQKCETDHMPLIQAELSQMMNDFLTFPDGHMNHFKRTSNSIIMSLLFGIRTKSCTTKHFVDLYDLMDRWSEVMEVGSTPPVDIFPCLKLLPQSWFNNWVDRSKDVGARMQTLYSEMHNKVLTRRRLHGSKGSFMDTVLDQQEKLGFSQNLLHFIGGVLMEGGSDTVSTTMLVILQALALNPHVQQRAWAEIDAVCGENKSPTWEDYTQLPYISMITKEAIRWRPVTPLAFPHALAEDDVVDGLFLSKGTTVMINVWGLHHDPSLFPEPDRFDPSRFEGRTKLAATYAASANYSDRDHYVYGSGRRLCPGIHLAERELFLGTAKLLWGFQIERKLNSSGVPIPIDTDPEIGYTEGFLVCPKAFECKITPRSQLRADTISREFELARSEVFVNYD